MNKLQLLEESAVALPERRTMFGFGSTHINASVVVANSAAWASSSGFVSIANTVGASAGANVTVVQL
jgi:hypothetical protein